MAVVLVIVATSAAAFSATGVANADISEPTVASCFGIEASAISPPGSTDEPGATEGMPQVMHDLKSLASALGIPVGSMKSTVAQLHDGTHEACDEAIEALLGDLMGP
jgi:hypothetical protein